MIITTKLKKIFCLSGVITLTVFLGLLGTYLGNNCSWEAVIKLLTLPQCIIGYVIVGFALICLVLHQGLRQDKYHD